LAIYCHEEHGEPVSIRRVRQLRNQVPFCEKDIQGGDSRWRQVAADESEYDNCLSRNVA
jgi:hypothetical protein